VVPAGRDHDRLGRLAPEVRSRLEELVARASPAATSNAPPAIEVHHVPAPFVRPDPAAPVHVMRTMVETDRLPSGWREVCLGLDEVWVPSTFNRDVFVAAGLSPRVVRVVPVGIDTTLFRPDRGSRLPPEVEPRGFVFLSVFSWQVRKGWDLLLEAWAEEFAPDEDVTLVLKVQPYLAPPGRVRREVGRYIREALGRDPRRVAPVAVVERHLGPDELASLYAASSAFVLPSRGEGFGRPYLEAMASGLPTIGTRWGGNLDFMNDPNSFLVDIEGLEAVPAGVHPESYRGVRWARPSVAHLRRLMRIVFERPDLARARGLTARADAVTTWDVYRTCERLARELDRLLEG